MKKLLVIVGFLHLSTIQGQILEIEGDLDVHGNKISNVSDPIGAQDAVTKNYIDNILLNFGISIGAAGIQALLNAGYCPLEIMNAGVSKDSLYGKLYQGGLIFYLDDQDTVGNIKGLVCAPVDQGTFLGWDCWQYDIPDVPNVYCNPPSGPGAEIGDGSTNTAAIVSACSSRAVSVCVEYRGGGFDDWFLPSAKELDLMWENLADSDGDGSNSDPNDPGNLGYFANEWYWSSSEFDFNWAWHQNFSDGTQHTGDKAFDADGWVRAVRAF